MYTFDGCAKKSSRTRRTRPGSRQCAVWGTGSPDKVTSGTEAGALAFLSVLTYTSRHGYFAWGGDSGYRRLAFYLVARQTGSGRAARCDGGARRAYRGP